MQGLRLASMVRLASRRRPASLEAVVRQLRRAAGGHAALLRQHGARVGPGCSFSSPLYITNADAGFASLSIEQGARFGPAVLFDLSSPVHIGAGVAVSARCTFGGDARAGGGGAIDIGSRSVFEPGVTVCPGVTIGEAAWIGGHSVIVNDVPAGARVDSPALRDLNARG